MSDTPLSAGLDDWLSLLEHRHHTAIDLGLDRCGEVWRRMGAPRPAPKVFTVAGSRWFGVIKPLDPNMPIDPELKRLWGEGAYLHMRDDGALGYNWETPESYTYAPENRWLQDEETFVIQLGVFHYVFTLVPPNRELVANLNNIFRMTIDRQ